MYINKMLKYVRELDQFHCNFAYKWKQNINNNKIWSYQSNNLCSESKWDNSCKPPNAHDMKYTQMLDSLPFLFFLTSQHKM